MHVSRVLIVGIVSVLSATAVEARVYLYRCYGVDSTSIEGPVGSSIESEFDRTQAFELRWSEEREIYSIGYLDSSTPFDECRSTDEAISCGVGGVSGFFMNTANLVFTRLEAYGLVGPFNRGRDSLVLVQTGICEDLLVDGWVNR